MTHAILRYEEVRGGGEEGEMKTAGVSRQADGAAPHKRISGQTGEPGWSPALVADGELPAFLLLTQLWA